MAIAHRVGKGSSKLLTDRTWEVCFEGLGGGLRGMSLVRGYRTLRASDDGDSKGERSGGCKTHQRHQAGRSADRKDSKIRTSLVWFGSGSVDFRAR